jgi:prolipoprotein diacylglyceryltransferase
VNLFSILIGLGASLGLLRVLQVSPRETRLRWQAAGLITLAGSLIGARVGFLIAYREYFTTHPQEIPRLDLGGLSWPGAVAGALLFAWLGFKLLGFSTRTVSTASGVCCSHGRRRLAGGVVGTVAYGRPLPAGTWWGLLMPDDAGLVTLRLPLQPLALLSLLLLLPLTETLTRKSKKKGVKAAASFFHLFDPLRLFFPPAV